MKRLSVLDLGIKVLAVIVTFTISTILMGKLTTSGHRNGTSTPTSLLSNYADTDADPGALAGDTDDTASDDDSYDSDDSTDDTVSADDSDDDSYEDDTDSDDTSWDSTDDTEADEPEDLDDDSVSDDSSADDTSSDEASDDTSADDSTTNDWDAILPGSWLAPQSYGGEEYWNFNPRVPSVVKQYCARGCFSMSPIDTGVPGGMTAGTYSVDGDTLVIQFSTSQYVYDNLRGVSSSCFAADFGGEAITFCRPA